MKEITATPSTRRRRPEAVCHVCRSRRLRPSVAKCVPREADRGDGVDAEQRPLGFWGNDRGRRASPGPLSGQRKPRPRLFSMGWYGVVVHEAAGARAGPDQAAGPGPRRPSAASDGPRRRVRAVPHSSDLVDGRGELYERCGRRTRHPSAVALPDGERARVEFVRSRGRRARATAALVGVATR